MRAKPILLVTAGAIMLTTVSAIAVVSSSPSSSPQTPTTQPFTKQPPRGPADA